MTGSGAAITLSQSNAASKPSPDAQRRLAVYQSPCPMIGGPPRAWSRSRAAQPDSSIHAGPLTSFRSMSRSSGLGHRSVSNGGNVHGGAGSSVSNSSGFGARATKWASASAKGSGDRPGVREEVAANDHLLGTRNSLTEGRQVDERFGAREASLEQDTMCRSTGHKTIRRSTDLHHNLPTRVQPDPNDGGQMAIAEQFPIDPGTEMIPTPPIHPPWFDLDQFAMHHDILIGCSNHPKAATWSPSGTSADLRHSPRRTG